VNPSLVGVNTVDHEGTSSSDVIDRSVDEGFNTSALDDAVETVRVILLDLLPLSLGLLSTSTLEPDVLVTTVELFSNIHLHTVVGGDDDLGSTVELEQLSHAETGGTGTEQEDLGSDLGLELVESVNGARGGFEQGSLLVRDVGVLEDLGLVAKEKDNPRSALAAPEIARPDHLHYSLGNVFGKSTIHTNTLGAKVLTEQRLPSLTVMTQGQSLISTSVANIGSGVISDLKTLDVLSDGLDDTDSFVTGDKGELGHELSLVDVLVGSTDSTEDDCRGARGWSA